MVKSVCASPCQSPLRAYNEGTSRLPESLVKNQPTVMTKSKESLLPTPGPEMLNPNFKESGNLSNAPLLKQQKSQPELLFRSPSRQRLLSLPLQKSKVDNIDKEWASIRTVVQSLYYYQLGLDALSIDDATKVSLYTDFLKLTEGNQLPRSEITSTSSTAASCSTHLHTHIDTHTHLHTHQLTSQNLETTHISTITESSTHNVSPHDKEVFALDSHVIVPGRKLIDIKQEFENRIENKDKIKHDSYTNTNIFGHLVKTFETSCACDNNTETTLFAVTLKPEDDIGTVVIDNQSLFFGEHLLCCENKTSFTDQLSNNANTYF